MQILLIREDDDGSMSWKVYEDDLIGDLHFMRDIRAHLNTIGVRRLQIIPGA